MNFASAVQPSTAQTWLPAAFTAMATILCGWLVYRSARGANRISETNSLSAQQLAWTQQAMAEAHEAKADAKMASEVARDATSAAEQASRRASAAEFRLGEVSRMADDLMQWIGRVVRKAHEVDVAEAPSDVKELLRVINGGPPEISNAQLRHSP